MNLFEQWDAAKPYIIRALAHCKGTHTIDDVALMTGAGKFRIWLGEDCAMLTEFNEMPRMRILNVFAAGGSLKGLLKLEANLIAFAKENGCSRITELGREGWERVLPGAEKVAVALHRDI